MYSACMASTNVNISDAAYQRLKKLKLPGDSFSDVLLRELPDPCETCGEVLDYFEKQGVPKADPKLRQAMLEGRGRRSKRRSR
jgi:predicted CopG family antitoxin